MVLFVGGPLLMMWKYGLNPREALLLRPVRPLAWIGVLLVIPSGLIVATDLVPSAWRTGNAALNPSGIGR